MPALPGLSNVIALIRRCVIVNLSRRLKDVGKYMVLAGCRNVRYIVDGNIPTHHVLMDICGNVDNFRGIIGL